jgi:phosphopantetheinyl transferase
MDADEQEIVMTSALGPVDAAVRVWTTKEAVAKMLNIQLADAWARTHVLAIESEQTHVRVSNAPTVAVVHETVDNHLFTLAYTI